MAIREATQYTMHKSTKAIAVFGVGPGLGRAVARRYAREGYRVVLVARRRASLEQLGGDPDALYYAPTPGGAFVSAANLTSQQAIAFMPLSFVTLLELVQEFLPHMLAQGDGAILAAQGASGVQGLPNLSGPDSAQVAQRNYLQSLHAEVAKQASMSACSLSVSPSSRVPSTTSPQATPRRASTDRIQCCCTAIFRPPWRTASRAQRQTL